MHEYNVVTAKIYTELADWFPLLTPPSEYRDEASALYALMRDTAVAPLDAVLELGSGGGHVASHLTGHVTMTLVDREPSMLALSSRLNPGVEHVVGNMFTVRLGRKFDAVLVHDAASHVLTEGEARALARTAATHLRSGGVAVICPDHVADTFAPAVEHGGVDAPDGSRKLRYAQRTHDPDPTDGMYVADLTLELTDAADAEPARTVTDALVLGMLSRETWLDAFTRAGFTRVRFTPLASRTPGEPWMHEVLVADQLGDADT